LAFFIFRNVEKIKTEDIIKEMLVIINPVIDKKLGKRVKISV
jgi:hypothetical protein